MYQKYVKRPLDLFLSILGLIVLSGLILILTIIIKSTSPGPAIFTQKRKGSGDKEFIIYKFRTMRSDTPKDVPTHLLGDQGNYITAIGHFMRKTSLDEIPQIFNIIKGDMSIVGPRPALWNQDDLIELREKNGSGAIRPGLTGLAQINGRDELCITKKAELDGQYAENITLLWDVKIFMMTIFKVLKSEGIQV